MERVNNQLSTEEGDPVKISRKIAALTRILSSTYGQADRPNPLETKRELSTRLSRLYTELSRLSILLEEVNQATADEPKNHRPYDAFSIVSAIRPDQLPELQAALDELQSKRGLPEIIYLKMEGPEEQSAESQPEYHRSSHLHR